MNRGMAMNPGMAESWHGHPARESWHGHPAHESTAKMAVPRWVAAAGAKRKWLVAPIRYHFSTNLAILGSRCMTSRKW